MMVTHWLKAPELSYTYIQSKSIYNLFVFLFIYFFAYYYPISPKLIQIPLGLHHKFDSYLGKALTKLFSLKRHQEHSNNLRKKQNVNKNKSN